MLKRNDIVPYDNVDIRAGYMDHLHNHHHLRRGVNLYVKQEYMNINIRG